MKSAFPPALLATLLLAAAHGFGQGVIGGNQNGLGPGGYLPGQPPAIGNPVTPVVTSLGMPGYDFQLVEISGQPVRVVDAQQPIAVPLASTAAKVPTPVPKGPGFWASFEVANNSLFPRVFEFVDQYYANLQIVFMVIDSNDTVVWQSYQTQVDIPPLAPKVHLTLAARQTWQKTVFVPLQRADLSLLAPGQYTLEAQVIGTPGYAASAPFQVSTLVGGPIVPITPVPVVTK